MDTEPASTGSSSSSFRTHFLLGRYYSGGYQWGDPRLDGAALFLLDSARWVPLRKSVGFQPGRARRSSGYMRKKILIVEDNTDLIELLRLSLKEAGFTVATAQNGVEALKKIRTTPPDLVVLDLVLPELDGFAVCEALRREPGTSAIPVLLLSGLSSEFARYTGLECGAHEFVTKPVSPDHLVSRIRHWLSQPAQPRPAPAPSKSELPASAGRID